ncbi:hypothetical protein OLMES_0458 [Oleiphilus messinensis]|uniref:Uncharacterized protein n=1 Tax=Oleiphilus messinensis TaxID=141451 RepID=A0A1Y0I270_9GAMM|nr:hypothetical protein [Oleiphilus messinensis]ARU54562.1 hypothetical protein OLMES_0458 [Oleiphilus messinensis]
MEYKSIYKNNDIFTAFPDPEEVFATDLEKSLLLPLGVYHLTDNGVHDILLAAPLGDEEGMIGKRNLKDRCGETWLSYSKKNGKWALECSLENFRSFDHYSENARKSLDEQKIQFQQNGFLSHPWGQVEKLSLFNTGGYVTWSNRFVHTS